MTNMKTSIGQTVLTAIAALLVGGMFVGGAVAPAMNAAGVAVTQVA
ncbi:hypothetical protein [Sphingomonas aracearum]|nr:hypothetical protein [Sphingomonas aracearum]